MSNDLDKPSGDLAPREVAENAPEPLAKAPEATQAETTETTTTPPVDSGSTKLPIPDPLPASTTVEQGYAVYSELETDWNPAAVTLPVPSTTAARQEAFLAAQPNVAISETGPGQEWLDALRGSGYSVPAANYFNRTVDRENAKWRQAVPSEKGLLGMSAPKIGNFTGENVRGEAAVLRVRAALGMGSVIKVPLWHSGFWITIKAPSDSELLELNRRISDEKVSLGRQTYGIAFANNSSFFAGHVVDFVLSHVYETSLKVPGEIRKKISSLDLPLLALGAATVIWPRGFQYVRAILDQSDVQTGVVKGKISPSKTLWTDLETLTPWQIAHMASSGSGAMTDEMVERYRKEFTVGQGRVVELAPNVSVTLRVPSIAQYLASGQRWVRGIEQMATGALGLEDSDSARDSYILSQGKATNFRQFGHWVESMDASGSVISDEETLDATFNMLSSDDEIRKTFFEAVRKMMEDSTIAIAAVPVTEDTDTAPLPRFPHLLPLDVLSVFFTLLVQRVDQIDGR